MTTTERRLLDRDLNAIVNRLRQPMSAEAAQNFYYVDVGAAVSEVLYLRREHAAIIEILHRLPLDVLGDLPPDADPLTVAQRAQSFFEEAQRGLWKERELAKARKEVDTLRRGTEASAEREAHLSEAVNSLTAELNTATTENAELRVHLETARRTAAQAQAQADQCAARVDRAMTALSQSTAQFTAQVAAVLKEP